MRTRARARTHTRTRTQEDGERKLHETVEATHRLQEEERDTGQEADRHARIFHHLQRPTAQALIKWSQVRHLPTLRPLCTQPCRCPPAAGRKLCTSTSSDGRPQSLRIAQRRPGAADAAAALPPSASPRRRHCSRSCAHLLLVGSGARPCWRECPRCGSPCRSAWQPQCGGGTACIPGSSWFPRAARASSATCWHVTVKGRTGQFKGPY